MAKARSFSFLVTALLGVVVCAPCTTCMRELPSHCANMEGDQTCAAVGAGGFCSACIISNDGCTELRPSDGCYYPGPMAADTAGKWADTGTTGSPTNPTSNMTSEETSEETSATQTTLVSTSESGGTTGESRCVSDDECDGPTPFCGSRGVCVASCGDTMNPDLACLGEDPGLPVCVGGICVSCEDGLMLTDMASGACVPCTEHSQCESGACDVFEGTCFDPERVVSVGDVGGFGTIEEGLMALDVLGVDRRGERRGVLVLHHSGNALAIDFDEAVTITSATHDAVAFMADDFPAWVNWTSTGAAAPTLIVDDPGVHVYLNGIRVSNDTNAPGSQSLRCNDAQVDIRNSRLVENLRGGILADGHCEVVMQNSFVGVNPDDPGADGVDAFQIADANVRASILYSTLGAGEGDGAAALSCVAGATVEVRNSLLVSLADTPEVDCPGVVLTTNATEAEGLGNMNTSWFESVRNSVCEAVAHQTGRRPSNLIANWLRA